jgi:hypothetical protein
MNPSFGPKKSAGRLSQGGHDGQNEYPHALEWLGRRAGGIVPNATTSTSARNKKSCDAGGAADGWFASGPFRPTTTCSCSPPQGPPPARSLHGADVSRECSSPSGPPRMPWPDANHHQKVMPRTSLSLLRPRKQMPPHSRRGAEAAPTIQSTALAIPLRCAASQCKNAPPSRG